jgi:hypothetical protein
VLCPNRYRVTLSASDYERLAPWEAQLGSALAELVQEHLDENNWTTIGDIEVYLARDEELHTGVFGVASRMESNAPPRQRPYDSLSIPVASGFDRGGPGAAAGRSATAPPPGPPYGPAPGYGPPAPGYGAAPYGPPAPQHPGGHQQSRRPVSGAALIVDATNQRFDLRQGSNVVGRGSDAHLQLLDQGVSRRHLDIQYDGQRATVYDLGSTNGTSVNGREVGSHLLRHGDVVRVGHTRMVFQQEQA